MSESFNNLIVSDIFTFFVGTGEKKDVIRVHSKAIAATCDYMKNLIEGDMKEAHDRTAEQDVEIEDFLRFVEYAYRGDYTAPSWVLEKQSAQHGVGMADVTHSPNEDGQPALDAPDTEAEPVEVVEVVTEAPVIDGWDGWGTVLKEPKKKKKTKSKASVFRSENFNKRDYLQDSDVQAAAIARGFLPLSNTGPKQNFKPVFLAYARLYSFAEMRFIHGLKALTLHKLHCTLRDFTLYPKRVGDIVELARHVYENTPSRTAEGAMDKMRVLVVDYIACESAEMGRSEEFKELLEEGGEFVSDFWGVVSSRII